MKYLLPILTTAIILSSCYGDYEEVFNQPAMHYIDLQDKKITFGTSQQLDIDANGTTDFTFYTLLVGDPILQRDRRQFYIGSKVKTNLLNDVNDESPVLIKGEPIMVNHPGYTWYEISAIVLTEKITPVTQPPFWQGRWSEADHKYLPVQLDKGGKLYMGWIELSMNKTTEALTLHRAGISLVPNSVVRAGH
jgi:hypothetical protein